MAKPTLREKQEQLENEHFAEVVQDKLEHHDQQFIIRAHQVQASLNAVGSIANFLMSQHIRGLMLIEQEKLWRGLGYNSFADFLTKDRCVIPSKTGYYEQRDVLLNSSDEVLDAITGKVSPRKVKALLSSGVQMSVEDGQLKIGDEAVEVSDTRAISAVIEGVHQSLAERDAREAKLERTIEKQKDQIRRGTEENEELRRNLDEIDETTRFERALMNAVNGLLLLGEAVGELDEDEKKSRGSQDLKLFAQQYFKLSDAYGVKRSLTEAVPAGDSLIDRAIAEMANDGSFEDLD